MLDLLATRVHSFVHMCWGRPCGDGTKPSDAQLTARYHEVIAINNAYIAKNGTSAAQFTNAMRVYTPERQALHRKIIDDILARAPETSEGEGRTLQVIAGLPGAGKTTARQLDKTPRLAIDPDEIKLELAKNTSLPPGMKLNEAAPIVHDESIHVAVMLANEVAKRGVNATLDLTMGSAATTRRRLEPFIANGYKIHGTFVDVSVETSLTRVMERFKEDALTELGGRAVPSYVITESTPSHGSKYKSTNRQLFDSMRHFHTKTVLQGD